MIEEAEPTLGFLLLVSIFFLQRRRLA